MRVLNTELRLRFKNRKPRPFNRAASADDAMDMGPGSGMGLMGIGVGDPAMPSTIDQRLNGATNMRTYH
ncbi:hypothetical protein KR038_004321, partial [Drosophila bunnanda]